MVGRYIDEKKRRLDIKFIMLAIKSYKFYLVILLLINIVLAANRRINKLLSTEHPDLVFKNYGELNTN